MSITESSITLNFPDDNYFRLGECDGYRKIQNHFAEMDACWYDEKENVLYLIELKDWQNNQLNEEDNPDFSSLKIEEMKKGITNYRIQNLVKKSIDTTCMLMSILLEKRQGKEIQKCMPFSIQTSTSIKLLSIINWTAVDSSYISHINTEYKARFKSYAKLFDVKTYLVLTKEQAKVHFNWIQ